MSDLDLSSLLSKAVGAIASNPAILTDLKDNPSKALQELLGVELDNDSVSSLMNGIMAQTGTSDSGSESGAAGLVEDLMGSVLGGSQGSSSDENGSVANLVENLMGSALGGSQDSSSTASTAADVVEQAAAQATQAQSEKSANPLDANGDGKLDAGDVIGIAESLLGSSGGKTAKKTKKE